MFGTYKAYDKILYSADIGSIYNICSGQGVMLAQTIEHLAEISGLSVRTTTDDSLLRPSENTVVIGSHALITDALGWRPEITLRQSISDILNFWKLTVMNS